MIGNNILRLVMGVLLSGVVLGQQPQGSFFGQQTGPTTQQQRLLQPLSRPPLSALQPRPSIANVGFEQPQAFNTLTQQRQGVSASRFTPAQPQGPQVPINEDIRDGPFHDGSYYFGYVSGDGSVREEGAVPTADGSFIVTGSYTYKAPYGEVISMEYIADANGYRAFPKGSRADFTSPQRILNAPPLPNTPFVDEVRQDFNRPFLNQRPQAFRPVNNNLNNQANLPFNRPVGSLSNNLSNQVNRPNPQQILGANRLVGNSQNTAAASNNINIIAEPIQENNI